MPDIYGQMSAQEIARAQQWLQKVWRNPICPVSGDNEWELNETLVQTRPYDATGMSLGGATFPLFVVTCKVCGYTFFINAITAGIVAPAGPQSPQSILQRVPGPPRPPGV